MPRLRMMLIAMGAAVLAAGCSQPATPVPAPVTPIPTATPTPTPVGGIVPRGPPEGYASTTTAQRLAEAYAEDPAEAEREFGGRYVTAKGLAIKAGATEEGGHLLVLEGSPMHSVVCAGVPRGYVPFEVLNPLAPLGEQGLPVRVWGRNQGLQQPGAGNLLLTECVVVEAGRTGEHRVAELPVMATPLHGWGMFWGWAAFAVLGYVAAWRWRSAPWGLRGVYLAAHTAGAGVLYAFLGSLVLPFYNTGGAGNLAIWPLILLINPS